MFYKEKSGESQLQYFLYVKSMRDLLPLQLLQKHLTFLMSFATFSTLNTRSCQSFAYS